MIQDVFLQYAWWEDLGAYLFYTIYFLISHEVFFYVCSSLQIRGGTLRLTTCAPVRLKIPLLWSVVECEL